MLSLEEDTQFIKDNPLIIAGYLLTAILILLYVVLGGIILQIMAPICLIISLLLSYQHFPKLILGYISFCIIFFTLYFYLILKESNILLAGFTLVLVIITAWYASISERQFRVMESGKKGRYLAEISRSIFSPMQIDLKRVQRLFSFGYGVHGWNPIILSFKDIQSPSFYLNDDIEIIPRLPHDIDNEGFLVVRSAKQLLKTPDPTLTRYLPQISRLAIKYDTHFNQMIASLNSISTEIPNLWPTFKTKCDELDVNNVLSGSDEYHQFIFKCLLSKSVIIEHIDQFGDHSSCIYNDEDHSIRLLSGRQEIERGSFWIKQLEYFRDNKGEL